MKNLGLCSFLENDGPFLNTSSTTILPLWFTITSIAATVDESNNVFYLFWSFSSCFFLFVLLIEPLNLTCISFYVVCFAASTSESSNMLRLRRSNLGSSAPSLSASSVSVFLISFYYSQFIFVFQNRCERLKEFRVFVSALSVMNPVWNSILVFFPAWRSRRRIPAQSGSGSRFLQSWFCCGT